MRKKPRKIRTPGMPPLVLLDHAMALLRNCGTATLGCYYMGAVPFVLVLLYFWTTMSSSADAYELCGPLSLLVAAAFIWMRCWQAVFCNRLRCKIEGCAPLHWGPRELLRLIATQGGWAPGGLFLQPLALPAFIFPWTFAFYNNLCAGYSGTKVPQSRDAIRQALKNSSYAPAQNHSTMVILFVCTVAIFINCYAFTASAPFLLKRFTGIESLLTRNPWALLNSSFFIMNLLLSYLCIDPLTKSVYALRCSQVTCRKNGADLLFSLKKLAPSAAARHLATLFLVGISLLSFTPNASAAEEINAEQLDQHIEEVIHSPAYTWRMPRHKLEQEDGAIIHFFNNLRNILVDIYRKITNWLSPDMNFESGEPPDLSTLLRGLIFALAAAIAALLIYALYRRFTGPRAIKNTTIAQAKPIDLEDADLLADAMPEDEWLQLAATMCQAGELRKALRAFFLYGLSTLNRQSLIRVARYKTNMDYNTEMKRNARRDPNMIEALRQGTTLFEAGWYGDHPVGQNELSELKEHMELLHREESA